MSRGLRWASNERWAIIEDSTIALCRRSVIVNNIDLHRRAGHLGPLRCVIDAHPVPVVGEIASVVGAWGIIVDWRRIGVACATKWFACERTLGRWVWNEAHRCLSLINPLQSCKPIKYWSPIATVTHRFKQHTPNYKCQKLTANHVSFIIRQKIVWSNWTNRLSSKKMSPNLKKTKMETIMLLSIKTLIRPSLNIHGVLSFVCWTSRAH